MTGFHVVIPLPVYGAPAQLSDRPPTCLPERPLVVIVFLYHRIPHGHLFGCCQVIVGSLVVFLCYLVSYGLDSSLAIKQR
jgi:hypothetical protein